MIRVARRWTGREDKTLARLYATGAAVREIARRIGRSEDAVNARRRQLGIAARRDPRWTEREDALLSAAAAAGVPPRILAERLGRPVGQVRWRRRALGLGAPAPTRYGTEEDRALRALFHGRGDLEELARRLGRSPDALRLRARKLGLYRPAPRAHWTPGEDAELRDGYTRGLTCRTIARGLPGRSAASVAARARKLGLATHARRWAPADDQRLHRLARTHRLEDAARLLGRTPDALRLRARKLGIAPPDSSVAFRAGARWTMAEDELLALHAALNPAALARMLGRSDGAVTIRLAQLGLREGRERSPHRCVPRNGHLTPGEQALVERELRAASSRRLRGLAERLELPAAALQALPGLPDGASGRAYDTA